MDIETRSVLRGVLIGSRDPSLLRNEVLADIFTASAAEAGDKVLYRSGDRTMTWREADELTTRLARRLAAIGAGPGKVLGLWMPRGIDLLLAQVNQQISETNLKNTRDILAIAREKFELGKTSRNEILQLQLEQLKAEKALGTARRDLEIATLNLKAYTGLQQDLPLSLQEPVPAAPPNISAETAIDEAFANRADAIGFGRRALEAERNVAEAAKQRGLRATLTANLGYSNRGQNIGDLYQQPQNQELVSLEFTMPILDWGRGQSSLKTAQANRQLAQYSIEQDKQNFRQAIYTQVTLFDMLKSQLSLTQQADAIAAEKYQIARERYVLGDLSITDLSIAFAEKDQARRDFVGALREYWTAFYQLRKLTLYDFEKQQKL